MCQLLSVSKTALHVTVRHIHSFEFMYKTVQVQKVQVNLKHAIVTVTIFTLISMKTLEVSLNILTHG